MSLTAPQNAVYQYTKTIAETAYIYGYAIISLWIIMTIDVNTKAPFNEMYYSTGLTTPTYGPFRGPNSDALYATAWLDLTNTPILLTTPDTRQQNRWYTVQLLDIFTNTFANLPGLDKNKPSKTYYIVGPDWEDDDYIVPWNAKVVKSPSNIVYLVSRIEVKDHDVNTALNVMHQITIQAAICDANVLQVSAITNSTSIYTSLDFYSLLLQILKYNYPSWDQLLMDTFNTIGLNPNIPFSPTSFPSYTLQAYTESIDKTYNQIIPYGYQYATGLVYIGSWQGGTKNGAFGNDFLRRAFASYSGPAANIPQEQFYVTTAQDSLFTPLNGSAHNYTIHFNINNLPQVNVRWGFWSLTVYTSTLQFYPNSINRYAVGSNNHDLVFNSDGSLDVFIQNIQPVGSNPAFANWLPCPSAPFRLILRMYSATSTQIQNPSNVPPVLRNDSV